MTGGAPSSTASARPQQLDVPVGGVVRDWQPPTPKIVSRLKWPEGGIQRRDFAFLKSVTKRTAKVTMPSPSMLHFRGGRGGVTEAPIPTWSNSSPT